MKHKFFKVSSIIGDDYDLIIPPSSRSKKSEISQSEIDETFILKIKNWILIEKLDLAEINKFLDYQLKWYPGKPIEFINHIESILKKNANKLQLFDIITREINNWINLKKLEISPTLYSKKKSSKPLPIKFEEIFIKESHANKIIDILKKEELIYKNLDWKGFHGVATEIIALIKVLNEKGYLKKYLMIKGRPIKVKKAPLGQLFCSKFNIIIKDRSLTNEPQPWHVDNFYDIIPDLLELN